MGNNDSSVETFLQWIKASDNIVFFGGAGVSTESGIPDFRSVDGLYNQKYDYPPETILSHSFFMAHPEEYYKFHRDKLVVDGAKPNRAHLRLAELEREGKLQAVITQNIDGLHQKAGSKNVFELHGSIYRNYCEKCGKFYAHYWNYKIDPKKLDKSWGDSIYTDFSDFNECSLKMCVEIFNQDKVDKLTRSLSDCDCIRFSDGFWYKFTKKNVTKENAIMKITEVCGFSTDSIIAFGDDYADIGMLELCGTGVAMGNAIDEVKERADIVIGSNDEEGIADFIENEIL